MQGGEVLGEVAQQDLVGGRLAMVLFAPDQFDELLAPVDQRGQGGDLGRRRERGCRLEQGADPGQGRGIEAIVLGHVAEPLGELAGAAGMQDANRQAGLAQGGDDAAFVAAGGFADDLDGLRMSPKTGAERGTAAGVVVEGEVRAGQRADERGFVDIQAKVDGGRRHGVWRCGC